MFGRKRIITLENSRDILRLKLQMAESRLAQYDDLMRRLKRHDWFEFTVGGGIVAHDKSEEGLPVEESDGRIKVVYQRGYGYVVPDEDMRCQIYFD